MMRDERWEMMRWELDVFSRPNRKVTHHHNLSHRAQIADHVDRYHSTIIIILVTLSLASQRCLLVVKSEKISMMTPHPVGYAWTRARLFGQTITTYASSKSRSAACHVDALCTVPCPNCVQYYQDQLEFDLAEKFIEFVERNTQTDKSSKNSPRHQAPDVDISWERTRMILNNIQERSNPNYKKSYQKSNCWSKQTHLWQEQC